MSGKGKILGNKNDPARGHGVVGENFRAKNARYSLSNRISWMERLLPLTLR